MVTQAVKNPLSTTAPQEEEVKKKAADNQKKIHLLTIGINQVNESHYQGKFTLSTPEHTADYFHEAFEQLATEKVRLRGNEATTGRFKKQIKEWANRLQAGDQLIVTYCGHGTRFTLGVGEDLEEQEDDTWFFYNRAFFDFEWWSLAQRFRSGVNLLFISDACGGGILESWAPTEAWRKAVPVPNFFIKHRDYYQRKRKQQRPPLQFLIPPTIVIMSSAPEKARMYETNKGYTRFGWAFKNAWEGSQYSEEELAIGVRQQRWGNEQTLQELYEQIQINAFAENRDCIDKLRPRWNYLQGHTYSNFSNRRPIFQL
jgi:hypothetical protein